VTAAAKTKAEPDDADTPERYITFALGLEAGERILLGGERRDGKEAAQSSKGRRECSYHGGAP